jgi:hypothetical protein
LAIHVVVVLVLVLGCFGDFEDEEDAVSADFSDQRSSKNRISTPVLSRD